MRFINFQQIVFLFINNVTNVIVYVIQAYLARSLTVEDFGSFNAINSYSMTMLTLTSVFPYVVTNEFLARKNIDDKKYIQKLMLAASYSFISLMFLLFCALPFVHKTFNFSHLFSIVMINFTVSESILFAILYGINQSKGRFNYLSTLVLVQNITRLFLTFFTIYFLNMGLTGAIFSIFVTYTLVIAFLYRDLKREYEISFLYLVINRTVYPFKRWMLSAPSHLSLIKRNTNVVSGFLIVGILSNIDIWVANTIFSPNDLGIYSSLSLTGKIGYFAVSSLTSIVFSQVLIRKSQSLNYIFSAIVLTTSGGLAYALFLWYWGDLVVEILWGSSFASNRSELLLSAIYMSLIGVLGVTFSLIGTLTKSRYSLINIAAIGVVALLWSDSHITSIEEFITLLLKTVCCFFVLNVGILIFNYKELSINQETGAIESKENP